MPPEEPMEPDQLSGLRAIHEETKASCKRAHRQVLFNDAIEIIPYHIPLCERHGRVIRWGSTQAFQKAAAERRRVFRERKGLSPRQCAASQKPASKWRCIVPGWYILDSGASMHAMGRNRLGPGAFSMFEEAPAISVITANGTVDADTVLPTHVGMLGTIVRSYIMDQADPLLSIGQLVAEGFGFAWPPSGPTLTTPDGDVIHLRVDNNNPILDGDCRVVKNGGRRKLNAGRKKETVEEQIAPEETPITGGGPSSSDPHGSEQAPLQQCGVCGEDPDVPDMVPDTDDEEFKPPGMEGAEEESDDAEMGTSNVTGL